MCKCIHYKSQRKKYLSEYIYYNEIVFRESFHNFTEEKVKSIFYFWTSVNKLRNYFLDEMS
jgi:hypothetical protein